MTSVIAPAKTQELSDEAIARQLQEQFDAYEDYWEDPFDNTGKDDDDFVLDPRKLKKSAKRGGRTSSGNGSRSSASSKSRGRGRKRKSSQQHDDPAHAATIDEQTSPNVVKRLKGGDEQVSSIPIVNSETLVPSDHPAVSDVPPTEGGTAETINAQPNSGSLTKTQTLNVTVINQGRWTDLEEKLFLEGLEAFGRGWEDLTRHIKTRSRDCVKSHAQKHFIHLYLDGKPLPDKVKQSGEGYTLSGKPLNPDSAALRPYLKARKRDPSLISPDSPLRKEAETVDHPAVELVRKHSASQEQPVVPLSPSTRCQSSGASVTQEVDKTLAPTIVQASLEDLGIEVGADGKTEYARNRPRREAASKPRRRYTEDAYDLMPCLSFKNSPGDGQPGSQPYHLRVDRKAIALMDLHSHLLDTEVVGLLAGHYDAEKNECVIRTALPAQRKPIDADATITVEASEESLAEALSLADSLGLQIMGWYHSHPIFSTDPSNIDLTTQHLHQEAFKGYCYGHFAQEDEGEKVGGTCAGSAQTAQEIKSAEGESVSPTVENRPFLGAICGPYDPKLEGSKSQLNWFVLPDPRKRIPRKLHTVLQGEEEICQMGLEKYEFDKMLSLIRSYKTFRHREERHDFGQVWRGTELRKDKLVKSLRAWLVGGMELEECANAVVGDFVPLEEVLGRIREEVDVFNEDSHIE
ncbi:hypothetical protein SpCBS45565_g07141 [Spizellomyces sp. 'palustris']|nr:hypothetical protein SpCBS45565_g07141 [Spizellomyces sp. 'palustris']